MERGDDERGTWNVERGTWNVERLTRNEDKAAELRFRVALYHVYKNM